MAFLADGMKSRREVQGVVFIAEFAKYIKARSISSGMAITRVGARKTSRLANVPEHW